VYAAERLDELPEFRAAARRAHAAYFADLGRRQWTDLTAPRREPALAAMAADLDNLRLAWRYWAEQRDLDQLNKLVDSLWLLFDGAAGTTATVELTNDLLDILSSAPPSEERAAQETTLRTTLARALMAIKGYTPEVEEVYSRTLALFEGRELPQLYPVLRTLGSLYIFRAEFAKTAQAGEAILRLARQQDDVGMLVEGHLVLGPASGSRTTSTPASTTSTWRSCTSGPSRSAHVRSGSQQPWRDLPQHLLVQPVAARLPGSSAAALDRGDRAGGRAGPPVHAGVCVLPRRRAAPVAGRAGACPGTDAGRSEGHGQPRLPDLEGARDLPARRGEHRPGAGRGGTGPDPPGHRAVPGPGDTAGVLAADPGHQGGRPRHRRPVGRGPGADRRDPRYRLGQRR
jgi:hypothetical protein